ncbi:MAG: hypothetical protein A3B44_02170 [Candidatus Levybacteria bacterium RIFCSPLOWO2_01_FULL_38_21]|nr:MAG: hypothetical protein A3B44_02170 [Candidatus Levybacteria bacterium RIFCSPLOWO2_01_FULL_38_21]
MTHLKNKTLQKGQALLIVVLIMVISLTVGLSIASKTITNLRTSTEEANSAQALSAAETGIAQVIQSGGTAATGSFPSNNTSFNTSAATISGALFLVNAGNVIPQDEGADVWLVPHNTSGSPDFSTPWTGSLTIYWGDGSGDCNNAALEVITITGTQANPVSNRAAYDPCSARSLVNKFTFVAQSLNTVSGKIFYYTATISVTNGLLMRIVPFYTNTIMAVGGTSDLPSQGSIISSTGQAGNVTRKINAVKLYSSLPSEFFTYGLFVPK